MRDKRLNDTENTMLEYILDHVAINRTVSLAGEHTEDSNLCKVLRERGYSIEEVFTAKNPFNGRTHFAGEVAIGTRPCDYRKGDLSESFLRACRYWNKFFILMSCACYNKQIYQKKIVTYIRRYKYIEKVDAKNNWIIFSNLD